MLIIIVASNYMKLLGLSFPDLIGLLSDSPEARESTLRQAQGDMCHGELVEPWIVRSSLPAFGGSRGDQGRTMTIFCNIYLPV